MGVSASQREWSVGVWRRGQRPSGGDGDKGKGSNTASLEREGKQILEERLEREELKNVK